MQIVAAKAGASEDDYAVYVVQARVGGVLIGTPKVVRLTDARSLYPFDGAEEIGPFPTVAAAKGAALARGREIIRAYLENAEL